MSSSSPGVMTLNDIDVALADWDAKRAVASDNMLELMDNPTYKALTGFSGSTPTPLTGITKQRVEPALKSLDEIWELFAQMGNVVDQAHALRKAARSVFNASQLLEIENLLTGPSVKLSAPVGFAQRSLLTPAELTSGISLERVMQSMVQAYEEGKAVVLEVESVIDALHQALAASTDEVRSLKAIARTLGEGSLPELNVVDAKVNELIKLIYSDPLGVKAGFEKEIEPLLKPVRLRINALNQAFEQVKSDLAKAHKIALELTAMREKAALALAERQLKVTAQPGESLTKLPHEATITRLNEWLGRLDKSMAEGNWQPISIGVANWLSQASAALAQCEEAYNVSSVLLLRRKELRGYLGALKTKAEVFGRGEDASLSSIYRAAHQAVWQRPTDLVTAARLVDDYANQLR